MYIRVRAISMLHVHVPGPESFFLVHLEVLDLSKKCESIYIFYRAFF